MQKLVSFIFCLVGFLIFTSCSTSRLPTKQYHDPVDYSIIYLIHGDANYLYHNQQGNPRQADRNVLQEAKWVGQHAQNGEVFIFHLKPETKFLYLFPRKDRHFMYYRNGELVYEEKYSPHSKQHVFVTEQKLYQHFHHPAQRNSNQKQILLYFGHEVPVQSGTHYFRSRPDASFNTALFADGVNQFLEPTNNKFDLVVLSTCDNGTPLMIHKLAPTARYVLASPLNLHLSHMDTKMLLALDESRNISTKKLASKIATDTFNRLSSFLQTAITLTLYDISRVNSYLSEWTAQYKKSIQQQSFLSPSVGNSTCATLPFFNAQQAQQGVKVWYRPPQFGKKVINGSFNGWGCKKLAE